VTAAPGQRRITGRTRVAAVIGSPVAHSLSPAVHNAAFAAAGLDWIYVAYAVAPGDGLRALDAVRALDIAGLSVTMPHKHDAALGVDELSATAARLQAVNCIVNRDGKLHGHNTDGIGFVDALAERDIDVDGMRCVVLGAGGAARAVIDALVAAGGHVAIVNRTPLNAAAAAAMTGGRATVGDVSTIDEAGLIVNATAVGMGTTAQPTGAERIHGGQIVAELVYQPAVTAFMAYAESRGATVVGGLGMLVHQAAHAFELWTGTPAPVAAMWSAVHSVLN
jgi:shikimate dehydrogenase